MDCMPGMVVFSEPRFQVMILVVITVRGFCCGIIGGGFCMRVGCIKFGMWYRYFRNYVKRDSGRYENISCRNSKFG